MGPRAADNPAAGLPPRTLVPRALVAAAALLLLGALVPTAAAQTDTEAEREAVRDRQDALAETIDVLQATDAEVHAALDELDRAVEAQERTVEDALAAADAAATVRREAEAALRSARRDVAALEQAIAEMAVASYIHPPTADLVQSLQAASISDALLQKIYLDARARRDVDLLRLLAEAERTAEQRTTEAAAAAAEADRALEQADAELAGLQGEQQRQADFAAGLEDRIDGALAEAAVLADLDAELSEQIAREQAELIARLPPPTTTTTTTTTLPATDEVAAPTTTTPDEDDEDADDEDVDGDDDRRSTPTPPLETVQGITVHAGIADDVDALLTAAAADGIRLSGSGYRSTQRQIELRRINCGPTDYDIWERPASTCSPPTATPGRSMHEQGRAIDFLFEGRLITSRSNDGFRWLAEHAADHGLFNLPSEPWHWSTSGS